VVLNTNPYTYLGNRPLDLSGAASLKDRLVVITFRTLKASAIVSSLVTALKGGGVQPNDHLVEWTDVSELVVNASTPFPYQVDGDYLGETTRLEFSHVPDAVRLVYPGSISA
jgi:diacylglycerol kinase family enzyme